MKLEKKGVTHSGLLVSSHQAHSFLPSSHGSITQAGIHFDAAFDPSFPHPLLSKAHYVQQKTLYQMFTWIFAA